MTPISFCSAFAYAERQASPLSRLAGLPSNHPPRRIVRAGVKRGIGRLGMSEIPVGAKGSFNLVVAPEHLANRFKDALLPPVLATPIMILAMENAALNAIRGYFGPGESAVGTAIDIRHIAATPVGQRMSAEAEVTEVDGRRIVFAVIARDEVEEIGRGTHERMVVSLARLKQRLDAKGSRHCP
jgi:fluoroacetyl-CoA thioesterase